MQNEIDTLLCSVSHLLSSRGTEAKLHGTIVIRCCVYSHYINSELTDDPTPVVCFTLPSRGLYSPAPSGELARSLSFSLKAL